MKFELRSRLKDVLDDGKARRERLKKRRQSIKKFPQHDKRNVPYAVQTDIISSRSSLPMTMVFPKSQHRIIPNYRWQTATPSISTIRIESISFSNF